MTIQQQKARRAQVGDARPSQLIYSYGVGSLIDLPHFSVVVMGLDDWQHSYGVTISEGRLLASIREELDERVQALKTPPRSQESEPYPPSPFDGNSLVGVPVAPFPRWFVCPLCRHLAPLRAGLFEPRFDAYHPDRTRYVHANCAKGESPPTVIPSRFLIACQDGHLDDFPWHTYVHHGEKRCTARLALGGDDATGAVSEVWVQCLTCNDKRPMSDAFENHEWAHPCTARRPHLRDYEDECDTLARPILLGASNLWFPISRSALSIPPRGNELKRLVEEAQSVLEHVSTLDQLDLLRKIGVLKALSAYTNEQILEMIEAGRGEESADEERPNLRFEEWQVLTEADPERNAPNFQLRLVDTPRDFEKVIESVVLVERLREVNALIGFTRVESEGEFSEYLPVPEDRWGPLSRQPSSWVPAAEIHGEGIFIQFSEAEIQSWMWDGPTLRRSREYRDAHDRWRNMRGLPPDLDTFPGMRYVLVHSFAHALMRQLSLECGYSSASIRERLYVAESGRETGTMAGLLLFTAAPDSEGTLGGLVSLGKPKELHRHIVRALEMVSLCPSDPLCSEHQPHDGGTSIHGAACHSCLFVPETACERGNRYLDRAVLTQTFTDEDMSFFPST